MLVNRRREYRYESVESYNENDFEMRTVMDEKESDLLTADCYESAGMPGDSDFNINKPYKIQTDTAMKTNDLSNIMRHAWELQHSTGKTFAVCLSRSWVIFRLIQRMREDVVAFAYEKADGTLRKAKGTLRDVDTLIKGTGSDTPKTVRYYDTDVQGFRSFRVENLITVY